MARGPVDTARRPLCCSYTQALTRCSVLLFLCLCSVDQDRPWRMKARTCTSLTAARPGLQTFDLILVITMQRSQMLERTINIVQVCCASLCLRGVVLVHSAFRRTTLSLPKNYAISGLHNHWEQRGFHHAFLPQMADYLEAPVVPWLPRLWAAAGQCASTATDSAIEHALHAMAAAGVHRSIQEAALAAHPALHAPTAPLHNLLQSVPVSLHITVVQSAVACDAEGPPCLRIVADTVQHAALCSRLRHVLSSMSAPLLLELHIGCDFLMAPQCMHEAYMLLRAAEQLPGVSISLWLGGHAVLWEHQLPAEPEHSTCGAGAVDTDMSDTEAGSTNTGSTDTSSAHTTTSSAQCSGLRTDLHCAVSSLAAILQAAGSSLIAINVDVPSTWWHVLSHLGRSLQDLVAVQSVYMRLDRADDYKENYACSEPFDLPFAGSLSALQALTRLEIDCCLPKGIENQVESDLPWLTKLQVLKLPALICVEHELCGHVRFLQQLTHLDASDVLKIVNGAEWEDLAHSLPFLTQLQRLDLGVTALCENPLAEDAAGTGPHRVMLASLSQLRALTALRITAHECGYQQLQLAFPGLPACLAKMTDLQSLHIDMIDLLSGPEHAMTQALKALTKLQHLTLSVCGSEAVVAAALSAGSMPHLTLLDLNSMPQRGEWLRPPGVVIRQPFALQLAQSLAHTSALRCLNLKGCTIGDAGAQELASVLPSHSQLTTLNLSFCFIGSKGARHLRKAVAQLPKLRELHLMCNNVGNAAAQGCVVRAARLSELQTLNLRHCGATAECIQALQVQLPSLTWLSSDCLKCQACSGMQSVHSYYCKVEGGALEHPCHELDLYSAHAPDLVQLMTAHATAAHVGSIES